MLTRRHNDEIELPASGRIWSVFGSAVHKVLEQLEGEGIEKEKRLNYTINNMLVSGKFDLIKNNQLHDYKVTSVWTLVFKDKIEEWVKQLSIYRFLYYLVHKKKLSDTAHIVAVLRDWTARDLGRIKGYPVSPIVELDLSLLSLENTEILVKEKIEEVKAAEGMSDDELPMCTDEERWYNKKKKKYNKCEGYCPAYKFCKQAQESEKD